MLYIRELYQYRGLFWSWTLRDLQIRYKQSLLGGVWAILQPLMLMLLFVLVFSIFVRIPTDGSPYPIFAYSGSLLWTFFATSVSFGVPSLVNNMNLVTKVYFPREILPIATIIAALFDLIIASGLLVLLMFLYDITLTPALVWVPIIIIMQSVFTGGIVLIGSSLNALYRDIRFIIPLFLQLFLYISPVIYPLSIVPEWFRPLYMLNPLAGFISSFRRVVLLGQPPEPVVFGLSSCMALLMFFIGYSIFKRLDRVIPDII